MKFYKQRNSNESFEYDVTAELNNIETLLERNKEDFVCGFFSAVAANYISNCISAKSNEYTQGIIFLIYMFMIYLILKIGIYFFKDIYIRINAIYYKNSFNYKNETMTKDFFFSKVSNELIFAVSLVNRVEKLIVRNEKMELRDIYLFQAKHCIEKINRLLHEETKDFSDKQYNQYKIIVGEEALAWVIDTSIMYMNKIYDINNNKNDNFNLNVNATIENFKYFRKKFQLDKMDY